jgi:glycosyltransferase involved in cell wall biosynthesis
VSVVSNGFQKFHLAALAAELDRLGKLNLLLTGGYPTSGARSVFAGLEALGVDSRRWSRLLARGERMDDGRVRSHWIAEAVYQAGARLPLPGIRSSMMALGMSLYAGSSARELRRIGPGRSGVFHYRSGFGGPAVRIARHLGMTALCDHSIVHPAFYDGLLRDGGKFTPLSLDEDYSPFWKCVVEDCDAADAILVNSDFVRNSFIAKGVDPARVHTIYLGVDDSFLQAIPAVERAPAADRPLRLLFAASLCDIRKGTRDLLEACRRLRGLPWELRIAGSIPADIRRDFADVLASPAVSTVGVLARKELAREMAGADVFVCPSLAEGSARVIFEAMACGCYIITTPNSGSIVESAVHGELVAPGDPEAIAAAIRQLVQDSSRIRAIGEYNASLVRGRYLQRHYGAAVLDLYERLQRKPAMATG